MASAIKICSAIETILVVVACWMFLSCFAANVPQTLYTGRNCQYVEAQSSHIFSIQPALARRLRLTVSFRAWFRHLSSTSSSFVLSVGEAPAGPYELLILASKTRAELSTCRGLALTEKGESFPVLLLRNASVEVASMSHIFISHVKAIDSDQLTITYHCGQSPTRQCLKVDTSSAFQHNSDNKLHHTRNKRTTNLSSRYKSPLSYSSYSVPAMVLFAVVGLLALMAVIAVCAKGTEPREHTGDSSLKNSAQQNENQKATTANNSPVSATEEVRLVMESPVVANSSQENTGQAGALADSGNHSETDQLSSRKSMEPLPLPPEAEAPQANISRPTPPPSPPGDGDGDEDEEDNPYDYARVPGRGSDVELSDNDSGNEAQQDEDGAARGPPGRYAKVTRHSASKETDYEPMPDLPGPPLPSMRERRDRSVTDPVDPKHVGEIKARSMTVVAESASGMPLPAVPPAKFVEESEEPEDDMYDCIKDDLKAAIRQSAAENQSPQKVYDSVDGENDMYESVTEEMKESVQQQLTPALPLSPVPKSQQKANSNSPSPTKRHSGSGFLDSPKTRKAKEAAKRMNSKDTSKEGKKKKQDLAPQEGESKSRHFSFIFNRKKTPSVSGKPLSPDTKQDVSSPVADQLPSPGHRPFSSVPLPSIPPSLGPRPAVPIPRPVSYTGHNDDADEDEGGMYDSVTQPISRSVPDSDDTMPKLVPALRGGANPHLNEPLPDVPEDSGSGSAGGGASVVKHPRLVEMSDPSYDTVVGTQREEELPCDPNYDTVQLPRFARKPQQQPLPVSASTTTPPYRPSPERDESVSHDEQGYAVVDPNVILRKRVSSLSKSAMKEANDEPGYEKVKKDDLPSDDQLEQSEEPGYESVTKQQEVEYDSLDKIGETEAVQPVEPGYASVTRLPDGTPKLEQDESAKEPGYEKVRTDGSSNDGQQADEQQEPDYDSVTEQKEPEYDSLDQIEKTGPLAQPVEPGYATVTGHMAADVSKLLTTGDKDDMYSHVDLAKKHKNNEADPQTMLSTTVEEDRVTSPAPPIPAQGDLGDISEFEPPPIPEPQFDLLDEAVEPPYATVTKSGSEETRKTSEDSPVADDQSEMEAVGTQADSTVSESTNKERLSEPTVEETVSEPIVSESTVEAREMEEEKEIVSEKSTTENPSEESTQPSATEETTTQGEQNQETLISVTATTSDKPDSVSSNRLLSFSLEESQPMYDSLDLSVPSTQQPNHTTSEAAKLPVENVYDSLQAVEATESS